MTKPYNPATEWVPISSGQMPEISGWYQVQYVDEDDVIMQMVEWITKACSPLTLKQLGWQAWRNLPEPYKPKGDK